MMKIALTGGIGTGKSYISHLLQTERGITVYDCDDAAKRLMRSSAALQEALSQLVGSQLFAQGKMQKAVLATFIMQSREHKEAVNNIVHPAVAADFEQSGLSWLESAIFFDSFFYRRTHIDKVVCVTAPLPTRLNRIMQRDHISRQKAQQWIDLQLPQDEIAGKSDFVICNDGSQPLLPQIDNILNKIK